MSRFWFEIQLVSLFALALGFATMMMKPLLLGFIIFMLGFFGYMLSIGLISEDARKSKIGL